MTKALFSTKSLLDCHVCTEGVLWKFPRLWTCVLCDVGLCRGGVGGRHYVRVVHGLLPWRLFDHTDIHIQGHIYLFIIVDVMLLMRMCHFW
jgi:hypothetical protein